MNLVKTIVDGVVSLRREDKAMRRVLREQGRRDDDLELRLAAIERASTTDSGDAPVRGFAAMSDIVFLIITADGPSSIPTGYWAARRLAYVPDEQSGVWGWRVDEQDTRDYFVVSGSGCHALFPGARGFAYLHHQVKESNSSGGWYDRGVWIMFAGDGAGMSCRTTGPMASGTAGSGTNAYPWMGVGNSVAPRHDSMNDIELGGGLDPIPALGPAILASTVSYPPAPWIEHHQLITGTPINVWWDDGRSSMMCGVSQVMFTEACPPPA